MVCIELAFADTAERLAARPAHRRRLTDLHAQGVLLAAGPWGDNSGALLVLTVDEQAAAEAIISSDPYFTTVGVTVVSIREWRPVVGPALAPR